MMPKLDLLLVAFRFSIFRTYIYQRIWLILNHNIIVDNIIAVFTIVIIITVIKDYLHFKYNPLNNISWSWTTWRCF